MGVIEIDAANVITIMLIAIGAILAWSLIMSFFGLEAEGAAEAAE